MEIFEKPVSFGDYQLIAKVDQGGMAEVFLAVSPKNELQGQFLAIKKLLPHLNANKAFVNLLIHEAKIGVLLQHPGIAQVIDLGSHKNEFFIAMEFIHGKSLGRLLQKIREGKAPPLSLELSSYIILQILKALAFAHDLKDRAGRELNIIHRDLSPGNILLEYTGQVKLGDFGIATAENRLKPNFSSAALGKLVYMPPEQAVNDPAIRASDLYSLGIVYYELLTGALPFESSSPTDAYRKILDERESNIEFKREDIPNEIQTIIQKLLEKSPKKRYQSAPELFDVIVEAFKKRFQIDFRSNSTMDSMRKKLAEYMRKSFENEIIDEIQIVQEALRQQMESSDLKDTKPIQVSTNAFTEMNGITSVETQDDDAITRHFPLTENERASIIRGVSVDNAIERIADLDSTDEAFELISVTSYNDGFSSKILKHLPIEKRLEIVHLPRDEKETLKQRIPVLKITDQHQLKEFEDRALSFRPESAAAAPSAIEAKSFGKKSGKRRPQKKSYFLRILGFLGVTLSLAGLYYVFDHFYLSNESSGAGLRPTQQVSIVLTGDSDIENQRKIYEELVSPSSSLSLINIEKFFDREFQRYEMNSPLSAPVMKLMAHLPQSLNRSLVKEPDFKSQIQSEKAFEFLSRQRLRFKLADDATIILYLLDSNTIPDKNLSQKSLIKENSSIIFIDPEKESPTTILRKIAAEAARIFGAKIKTEDSDVIKVPEGLASPNQSPLFPQTHADLMGAGVPVNLIENRPVESFDEIMIGPKTAEELGWIK
ncbi:MAG: serine/threonine protein kinase [Bdellovibrionota bacterium]